MFSQTDVIADFFFCFFCDVIIWRHLLIRGETDTLYGTHKKEHLGEMEIMSEIGSLVQQGKKIQRPQNCKRSPIAWPKKYHVAGVMHLGKATLLSFASLTRVYKCFIV